MQASRHSSSPSSPTISLTCWKESLDSSLDRRTFCFGSAWSQRRLHSLRPWSRNRVSSGDSCVSELEHGQLPAPAMRSSPWRAAGGRQVPRVLVSVSPALCRIT